MARIVNPIEAFLAALEPLRIVAAPVLCETCATVRPRIRPGEARILIAQGEHGHPRQIRCRTSGCDGWAIPITPDDLAMWRQL